MRSALLPTSETTFPVPISVSGHVLQLKGVQDNRSGQIKVNDCKIASKTSNISQSSLAKMLTFPSETKSAEWQQLDGSGKIQLSG